MQPQAGQPQQLLGRAREPGPGVGAPFRAHSRPGASGHGCREAGGGAGEPGSASMGVGGRPENQRLGACVCTCDGHSPRASHRSLPVRGQPSTWGTRLGPSFLPPCPRVRRSCAGQSPLEAQLFRGHCPFPCYLQSCRPLGARCCMGMNGWAGFCLSCPCSLGGTGSRVG